MAERCRETANFVSGTSPANHEAIVHSSTEISQGRNKNTLILNRSRVLVINLCGLRLAPQVP